jgi:ferric-dicitrate binding protein FerR (iron transport regulator)
MKTKIKKYLEGEASPEEILSLTDWLDNKENRAAFKQIKSNWKTNLDEQSVSPCTLRELDKFKSTLLNERAKEFRKLGFIRNLYKYAALFLLLIIIGSTYFHFFKRQEELTSFYNTIIAENGQIAKAMLPDGTTIWLNSGSHLQYSNRFGIENRNVVLSGQAYFDVTKNKNLPFVVSCDEVNVKVMGTRFTAEAYPEDPNINVVLVQGAVKLTPRNNNKVFAILQPNEMMVYNKQDNKYKISEVVTEKYTSWREGIIHFYDQPLKDVVIKLQKRYNQKIILEKGLENYKVTFSIRNENFNDVLNMLLAIAPAKASQKGEIIYLKKNQ